MQRLVVLLLLPALVSCVIYDEIPEHTLCNLHDCECLDSGHPSWKTVNCNMTTTKNLAIFSGNLPVETTDLVVTGYDDVSLEHGAFSSLNDLRLVRIAHSKLVVFRRGAAVDLTVVSAYVEVEHCSELRVEGKAFSNLRGPLSVTIRHCDRVSIEGDAFSWLLKLRITDVGTLVLSPGAFTLEPTAGNVGEHGPGMSIELRRLTAPEIPSQAFGSSAAEIILESMVVTTIRSGAFSANTYNVISATKCIVSFIEGESFAQKSLINNLLFFDCRIQHMYQRAIQSAITYLNINHTRFNFIDTGAINSTVATVKIANSEFHKFLTRGIELSSWSNLFMEKLKFDALPEHAMIAHPTMVEEFVFADNEVEEVSKNSLEFVGKIIDNRFGYQGVYRNNYFGSPCSCNISLKIGEALGATPDGIYALESYCTVNEFFARCFNAPEQNIILRTFIEKVCHEKSAVQCEQYKKKSDIPTEIKNPRFPHKHEEDTLSERNKKVISIVIVTALVCVGTVMLISFGRWLKNRGCCARLRNIFTSLISSCCAFFARICGCGRNSGLDNGRFVSELSVHEYSERRRLNEPRIPENMIVETILPGTGTPCLDLTPMDDKTTQTLPEELTKELLENLKEKLEDPDNYVEAREMIEHLYELIKVEESCNSNTPIVMQTEENIYELPFQNTTPRIGKNKKQMISVGTRAPSLDKLLPLSPYNRQTALAHEYFEPKDFAVHLYAEIANCDKEKRTLLGIIPDIVEQVVPRGPYLRAVREKNSSPSTASSPSSKSLNSIKKSPMTGPSGSQITSPLQSPSSMKSGKSTASNSSGKMMNRPLPEKPVSPDPGEGPSMVG
ncbi:uncharacterized protein LOC114361052 [Ostrinia furnacalis]|uniref:uncharacterized protein LOC114361052 n=1 Tax=Ostrinia furnacalis TaxID=93504 RepID=UPI00103A1BC2|nr:uncharacterized protein LOC114361052 [Ostrinia furnacalis]